MGGRRPPGRRRRKLPRQHVRDRHRRRLPSPRPVRRLLRRRRDLTRVRQHGPPAEVPPAGPREGVRGRAQEVARRVAPRRRLRDRQVGQPRPPELRPGPRGLRGGARARLPVRRPRHPGPCPARGRLAQPPRPVHPSLLPARLPSEDPPRRPGADPSPDRSGDGGPGRPPARDPGPPGGCAFLPGGRDHPLLRGPELLLRRPGPLERRGGARAGRPIRRGDLDGVRELDGAEPGSGGPGGFRARSPEFPPPIRRAVAEGASARPADPQGTRTTRISARFRTARSTKKSPRTADFRRPDLRKRGLPSSVSTRRTFSGRRERRISPPE